MEVLRWPSEEARNYRHFRTLKAFGSWFQEEGHVQEHPFKRLQAPKLPQTIIDTLSDEEMNTYACPWHNNLTTVLASFRTAKALRTNPGSRFSIQDFRWRNSTPFTWHSQQLMDLGLMEPGQWF